VKGRWTRPVIR